VNGQVQWERLQEVFDRASQLPPESREEWLGEACNGDRTLYLQAHSLLLALDQESGQLEKDIASYASRLAAAPPPERVGPYRVVSEIGRGGMGAVYLAERADDEYQRQVAIKLIRAGAGSPFELLRRFRMERQILAGLQHPNIARMLDGGVMEDGTPYLVMEFVEGVRIDQFCDRNQLTLRERIELFRQVCSAVQHAHRNLVVHRDIKPSNILVTREGVPKLLDFGIAKLLPAGNSQDSADQTALTRPAERLMTREYASPEQVRGQSIVTTTDVYALGIVLFELLAHRHPFADYRADFLTLERAICETEPRAPSASGSPFAAGLKGDLDAIVLKTIRKEPAERYASAEQLSEDLGRYLDGFPVSARHGSRRYRAGKFIRRHRFGVASATAFVLLLAGFGVSMAIFAAHLDRERTRSEKTSEFLGSLFSSSDPFHDNGQTLTAKDLLARGSSRISSELAGEPEVSADLLQTMAEAYQHLGDDGDAEVLFRKELDAAIRAYGPDSRRAAGTMRQIGDVRRSRGDLAGAEEYLRKSLAIIEKLPPEAEEERAHALNNLALVLQIRGNLAEAQADLEQAVSIAVKYPPPREALTMKANLGSVLLDRGEAEKAEKTLREVLADRRRILGEKHTQVPLTISALSLAVAAQGRYAEAEQLQRESLERRRALLGDDNYETRTSVRRLAGILVEEGALREAESLYRGAFEKGSTDENAFERALWFSGLGAIFFQEGRAAEAEALYQKALDAVALGGGKDSIREARYLTRYGEIETGRRNYDAAAKSLQDALAIYQSKAGVSPDEASDVRFQMAKLAGAQGHGKEADAAFREVLDADRAATPVHPLSAASHMLGYAEFLDDAARSEALARQALEIRTRILPPDFWSIAEARAVLAGALARQGRGAEARPMATGACQVLIGKLGPEAVTTRRVCHPSRGSAPSRE